MGLTEHQQEGLSAFAQIAGQENLALCLAGIAEKLKTVFTNDQGFKEPIAVSNEYAGPTMIGSSYMYSGAFDFTPVGDEGETLSDQDWWNDGFPDDIPIANLTQTFIFLS